MNRLSIIVILVLGFAAFGVSEAQAIAVTPATIDVVANRGETIDQEIVISNTGDKSSTYYISAIKFEATDEPGVPQFIPYEEDHSGLPDWIQFPERQITLAAGDVSTIVLTIAVPSDVAAGGHYAAILISENGEAGNVSVEAKTAVLILLSVEGESVYQADILEFDTDRWTNRLPVDFSFRVQNQGNVHLTPLGQIVVRDIFGTPVAGLPVNGEMGRILPMSTREFSSSWIRNEVLDNSFFAEMNNEWINFGLGRYKATLEIELDNGQTVTESTVFWIFPWHLAILTFIVLDILVLATIARSKLAKKIEEETETNYAPPT